MDLFSPHSCCGFQVRWDYFLVRMINWDRTVTETGTPSSPLVDVTIWLWIHNAGIFLPSSHHQPGNIKRRPLITGSYPRRRENSDNSVCSFPQLTHMQPALASPNGAPDLHCVYFTVMKVLQLRCDSPWFTEKVGNPSAPCKVFFIIIKDPDR